MNTIFWFRRDLRIEDNVGLYFSLMENKSVIPLFIFDTDIINELPKDDKRINFIYIQVIELKKQLNSFGSDLIILKGQPLEIFKYLKTNYNINSVYTNGDYEPYAIKRDDEIKYYLNQNHVKFISFKDQVLFEKSEIVKPDGNPYLVFTPYSKVWKEKLNGETLKEYFVFQYKKNFFKPEKIKEPPSLNQLGFKKVNLLIPTKCIDNEIIEKYHLMRDYPSIKGTSNISVHLRFGTISIRKLVTKILPINEKYLDELIWREYYMSTLYHFPNSLTENFNSKFNKMKWSNDETLFNKWCKGETGFLLIDAGMTELNTTGLMHNRVRMLVANFLTKLLLIDWRWGEEYFAKKLLDYEASSNVGNWQWAAGTGVDAAPFFRIFNPELQIKRFDKDMEYIKRWLPNYKIKLNKPIIDYKLAREKSLKVYQLINKQC